MINMQVLPRQSYLHYREILVRVRVRIFKSEYDEVMEKLTEGNRVRMDKVNLKNSRNVKYRYEIYVTSKSDFEEVID